LILPKSKIKKLIGKKILKAGIDVIIEWGTWLRGERCELRDEAWAIGSKVKFYYMKTDKKILQERIIERNKNLSEYDFHIPEDTLSEDLEKYEKQFQIPQKSELETYDYLG
jgi:predicted kinase